MKYIKFLSILFFLNYFTSYAQDSGIYQTVSIEKYAGKNFTIEGKIYYTTELAYGSYGVLGVSFYDTKGKIINNL